VLADRLASHLRHAVFAEVGPMQRVPVESQVLQKREGYREVFRLFFAVEAAALLAWTPDEATWHAGIRDVAALYEYWVYLRLAGVVARVCGTTLDPGALLRDDDEGLTVTLRRGAAPVVKATVTHLGRPIELALYYNRHFAGVAKDNAGGSWTRGMRPDCSLQIVPRAPDAEPVWLHFDAKYRVDQVTELFGKEDEDVVTGRALRDDLAKMHAYRDAIRRTAGAFVVYPGDEFARFPRYHELLPGLGAFPLAPTEGEGPARGEAELEGFVREVIEHVAKRATQHERWRYWTSQIFAAPPTRLSATSAIEDDRPPADIGLLIAVVKSAAHLDWVRDRRRYNLRADGREGSVVISPGLLAARYVLLHGEALTPTLWRLGDSVEAMTGESLAAMGYPKPGGTLYLLLRLEVEVALPVVPSSAALDALRGEGGGAQSVPVLRSLEWLLGLETTE